MHRDGGVKISGILCYVTFERSHMVMFEMGQNYFQKVLTYSVLS